LLLMCYIVYNPLACWIGMGMGLGLGVRRIKNKENPLNSLHSYLSGEGSIPYYRTFTIPVGRPSK